MKAKKSLGQNFLFNKNILKKISKYADKNLLILEVGPGKGSLTDYLIKKNIVWAVEKDQRLCEFLKEKYKDINNFKLFCEDVLKFNFDKIKNNYQIVANLPYYITGQFFRTVFSQKKLPKKIVVLLQKEVVERITGEKNNLLKSSIEIYGHPRYLFTVPARFFKPKPKVDSAVLLIKDIERDDFINKYESDFFEFLKLAFKRKRAQLQKNLKERYDKNLLTKVFDDLNLDFKIRAEDLSTGQLKEIFLRLKK